MHRIRQVVVLTLAAFGVLGAAPRAALALDVPVTIRGAGSVWETTAAHKIDCQAPATTPTGAIGAVCTGTGYGLLWKVTLAAAPAPGYSFQGWSQSGSNCVGMTCSIDLGFSNQPVTATFSDSTAPNTQITGGPAGTVPTQDAHWMFGHDQEGASFECRYDESVWYPCDRTHDMAGLSEGPHTMSVRAIDPSGNVDASPATRSWTVDTSAPSLNILGGPGALSNATSHDFWLYSFDSDAAFDCRHGTSTTIVNREWRRCSAGFTVATPTDGTWQLQARAVDPVGNVGYVVTRTWTVDTAGPVVVIAGGVGELDVVPAGDVTFQLQAGEAAAAWECTRTSPSDTVTRTSCPTPFTVATTVDGVHAFAVRARDAAGNWGAWTKRTWTVDATPPPLPVIVGGPAGDNTSVAAQSFAVTVAEAGVGLACRSGRALDVEAASWQPCQATAVVTATRAGDWVLEARATDAVGNVTSIARRSWTYVEPQPEPSPEPQPQPNPNPQPNPGNGQPAPTGPAADTTAPSVAMRAPRSVRSSSRVLRVSIRCGEACSLELATVPGARGFAAQRTTATAGAWRTVTVRIRPRGRQLTLRVTARDAAGNRTVRTVRVQVRR